MSHFEYPGKPPNAVCDWCENFERDQKWCATYQIVKRDSQYPRRCIYYIGPELTGKAIEQLKELELI